MIRVLTGHSQKGDRGCAYYSARSSPRVGVSNSMRMCMSECEGHEGERKRGRGRRRVRAIPKSKH